MSNVPCAGARLLAQSASARARRLERHARRAACSGIGGFSFQLHAVKRLGICGRLHRARSRAGVHEEHVSQSMYDGFDRVACYCDVYVAWRHRTAMSVRSASQGVSGVRAVRLARAQMCLVSIGECHQLSTRWTTMYSCVSESTTDVPRHSQTLNYRPEALGAVAPDRYDAGCPRAPPNSAPVAIGSIRSSLWAPLRAS